MITASKTWLDGLDNLLSIGSKVRPRGEPTLELPQTTFVVDMRAPVVLVPERKLSYTFMAAEAYWIMSGDDRVSTIAPYNKRIADFSDDGVRFFGAYGPPIVAQLPYVIEKLTEDQDTRQAGLTIWRQSPPATKDVPCTVALFWQVRGGVLNCHAFMRSSDIWLGLPYDVFNFSMISHKICGHLNMASQAEDPINPYIIKPGRLYLTAASSHLYKRDESRALECLNSDYKPLDEPTTPPPLWLSPDMLMMWLRDARDGLHQARWWEHSE